MARRPGHRGFQLVLDTEPGRENAIPARPSNSSLFFIQPETHGSRNVRFRCKIKEAVSMKPTRLTLAMTMTAVVLMSGVLVAPN